MRSDTYLTRDEQIAAAIEAAIQARMPQRALPIDVAVQGATATLTGYVANQASKDVVIALAGDVEGVLNVVDNLRMGGGHPVLDLLFPWRNPNEDLVRESEGSKI